MSLILLLLNAGILLVAALWIYRRQESEMRSFFWPALLFKLVAGFSVGFLYFYHYGQGDTILYWQDGKEIAQLITNSPTGALGFFWEESTYPEILSALNHQAPRSLFFVKIAGLLALATGSNYWMMSALLSFISFLGAWYLFQKVVISFPSTRNAAGIAFLFYPSVSFWSAGLIKESLGLAAIFMLAGCSLTVVQARKPTVVEWLLVLASLWIGWNLKYYWLGIFLPVAITTILVYIIKMRQPRLVRHEVILWLFLFLVLMIGATSIHPNFYPSRFAEVIYQNNLEFMRLTDAEGAVHFHDLQPTIESVVVNSPSALVACLFRPFIWESSNILSVMAGIENLILAVIVVLAFPGLSGIRQSPHRLLVLAAVVYIVLLATLLALSTPNFGTLSRYKVGVLPFLLFVSLLGSRIPQRWLRANQ